MTAVYMVEGNTMPSKLPASGLFFLPSGVTRYLLPASCALWGADWPLQVHETAANVLLALVGVHVLAAVYESIQVKDNLPLSMLTGRRKRLPDDRAQ